MQKIGKLEDSDAIVHRTAQVNEIDREDKVKNMKRYIKVFLYPWIFGFACVSPSPGPAALNANPYVVQVGPDTRLVTSGEGLLNVPGCPTCGETQQGPYLGSLPVAKVTLQGEILSDVRVDKGELVATRSGQTLRGEELKSAIIWGPSQTAIISMTSARASHGSVEAPVPLVPLRISNIVSLAKSAVALEGSDWNPLFFKGMDKDKTTHLYFIEAQDKGQWKPVCTSTRGLPFGGWAIPIGATWGTDGARKESTTRFTFACMRGALAKCYRWGYRPWVDDSMRDTHQACTRMARADYCGTGHSMTKEGIEVNIQDYNLSKTIHTFDPNYVAENVTFEAMWGPDGAYCASHGRKGASGSEWEQELFPVCKTSPYGKEWESCQPNNPALHNVQSSDQAPYLGNRSKVSEWQGGYQPASQP